MIPGKVYTPDDLLRAAWRHKWAILIPFVLVSLGTAGVAQYLPNRYRSETLILVVPARVPDSYVKATVTTRIEERLQSISQQILSRTRLERIIQDFELYAEERRVGIMEDIVEKMRRDIQVQIVKGDAFRVAYTGDEPRTVMRVTERLASLFIDESLKDREVLAEGTNSFLETQLEDARRQLVEHEKRLEAFRRQHDGELPTQVDANLQTIRSSELRLQALNESINRDRDQKILVERQIAELSMPDPEPIAPLNLASPADGSPLPAGSASVQLEVARKQLDMLVLRYTAEHPDVVRMKRLVKDLEKRVDAEAMVQPLSPAAAPKPVNRAERVKQVRLDDLHMVHDALERNIANKTNEQKQLQREIGEAQARVAAAPTRESELVELTRDYDTLQKAYANLLAKQQDSKVAANLERRQIGEQFKVLDPARMPEKPYSPNRPLIDGFGALAGLALGIGMVALLEYRDTTLKTDAEVSRVLALPVLASVPIMITKAERRTQRRRRIMLSFATAVVVIAAAAVLVWKFHPFYLDW